MTTVLELAKRLRAVEKRVSEPKSEVALLFAAEVDRLYRLGKGTAHAAAEAGTVPAVRRRRGGRARWCYLITPTDAARMWGPR